MYVYINIVLCPPYPNFWGLSSPWFYHVLPIGKLWPAPC